MPSIRPVTPADIPAWDSYVEAHPGATFFHLHGWSEILGGALGHRPRYLLAEAGGRITGVLPLVETRSLLFGSTLASLPFCSYGGPLADDPATEQELEEAAAELARRLQVGSLELRRLSPSGRERPVKTLYSTWRKPILPSEEENLKALRGKQRNMVRKGIKAGLTAAIEDLEAFYPVYAESVRNLGTPVFPKRLFEAIHRTFPEQTEYLVTRHQGEPVSAAMLFCFRDEICPYYWGGRATARRLAGNDFLCWRVMCRGMERGCTRFDFGRSKAGTGSEQWKRHWGFEPQQLYYEYVLVKDREMPQLNPANPKYRLFIEAWKRLPLPVASLLGPMLSRSLG